MSGPYSLLPEKIYGTSLQPRGPCFRASMTAQQAFSSNRSSSWKSLSLNLSNVSIDLDKQGILIT